MSALCNRGSVTVFIQVVKNIHNILNLCQNGKMLNYHSRVNCYDTECVLMRSSGSGVRNHVFMPLWVFKDKPIKCFCPGRVLLNFKLVDFNKEDF